VIRAEAREGKPGKILFFFGQVNNARLYQFPVGQISRNLNTTRHLCRDESFWNRIMKRGHFSKKKQNFFAKKILSLETSSRHNSVTINDRQKVTTK